MTPAPRTAAELLADYRRGATVLCEAVAGMNAEQLRARPIAGKLSSLEVLCHIVDSDQFMCDRIKRAIATERPLIMGVESIDYPGPLHYQERDPELDLRLLDVQRDQLATDLERIGASAFERTAIHSESGLVTVFDLLEHAVEHLEDHVDRIAEKRAALGL